MNYRYETHLHTRESSACATCLGAEYPRHYKDMGYSGIIVTDHFLNGNTTIDLTLSWEEKINRFCSGYEHAKEAGDAIGFDVFFGWEHNFDGDEYLVYGCDKQWLLSHPDLLEWNHRKLYEEVHKAGGMMIQAHPFRMRNYITTCYLHPQHCDGVEVCNQGNTIMQDQLAYAYAVTLGLRMTGGTDIHHEKCINETCKGIATTHKLTCIDDYISLIMNQGEYQIITQAERMEKLNVAELSLPYELFDYEERKQLEIPAQTMETEELMRLIASAMK